MGMLCIQCTKSDLKFGLIYNRILTIFFGCAVFLDAVYYGFFAKDLFRDFAFNFLVVSLLSLYLFFTHSFAGGDCKLASLYMPEHPLAYLSRLLAFSALPVCRSAHYRVLFYRQ